MLLKLNKTFKAIALIFAGSIALFACQEENNGIDTNPDQYTLAIPTGFPNPSIPSDNQFSKSRVDLGKELFFDPILSFDSSIACVSCHAPAYAFSDTNKVSTGVLMRKGTRNAPAIINAAWLTSFFWDGGVGTLEQQAIGPIENHLEMNNSILDVVARLKKHKSYPAKFQKAYGRGPDVFTLTRALSCYERTLVSGNSRFDQFRYQGKDVLTAQEKRGMDIYFGEKAECFHCHGEYNLTDNSFKSNGLYEVYADSGRARITGQAKDIGKFKVPTLRNIAKTFPYMHDGSLRTLEQVVEHYNSGGKNNPNKSILINPLNLTTQEKADLVAFLKSLTDEEFGR